MYYEKSSVCVCCTISVVYIIEFNPPEVSVDDVDPVSLDGEVSLVCRSRNVNYTWTDPQGNVVSSDPVFNLTLTKFIVILAITLVWLKTMDLLIQPVLRLSILVSLM